MKAGGILTGWILWGLIITGITVADSSKDIVLPSPLIQGGKPLMEALRDRQSLRSFSEKKLPLPLVSNLLWAAFGINRPETGRRTAPSAVNWQETDLYVAMKDGLYLYDALGHRLIFKQQGDLRAACGIQDFVKTAPLVLVFVADYSKMEGDKKDFYSATDVGYISQNVYLFCASENLATVVLGMVDKPALAAKIGLNPDQRVILSQPVGYKK
ncbi:MAG: SagB/ThcOx family dehydrogenase [Candidatus Delongbacteria bacterium]|nr:SagB/ThcOx family dehydrogenase [Candidatus Delongbacteria bacterium]